MFTPLRWKMMLRQAQEKKVVKRWVKCRCAVSQDLWTSSVRTTSFGCVKRRQSFINIQLRNPMSERVDTGVGNVSRGGVWKSFARLHNNIFDCIKFFLLACIQFWPLEWTDLGFACAGVKIRWPSSAIFDFQFSTQFLIFVDLYSRFSILN